MQLTALTAISLSTAAIATKALPLADYFSEYATIRYRVKVEVEYFIALSSLGLPQLPAFLTEAQTAALRRCYEPEVFTPKQAQAVKRHRTSYEPRREGCGVLP